MGLLNANHSDLSRTCASILHRWLQAGNEYRKILHTARLLTQHTVLAGCVDFMYKSFIMNVLHKF